MLCRKQHTANCALQNNACCLSPMAYLIFCPMFRINSRMKGRIIISAEELDSSKDVVYMRWNGKKLDKKDLFGKSDPFMVFCRCNEDNRCVGTGN